MLRIIVSAGLVCIIAASTFSQGALSQQSVGLAGELIEAGMGRQTALTLVNDLALEPDELYIAPKEDEGAVQRVFGALYRTLFGREDFRRSFAFVVGVSEYEGDPDHPDLPATKPNPDRMRNHLIGKAGFDVVITLKDERAALSRIDLLMKDVFPRLIGANDRFLFYFSGHGTQFEPSGSGPIGHLVLTASRGRLSRMISMNVVEDWARRLDAARHMLFVLDACFSGLAGQDVASPINPKLTIKRLRRKAHHIISAGTKDQKTIAAERWNGSLFTNAFLLGAEGRADESNREFPPDGIVSLSELRAYIQQKIDEGVDDVKWPNSIEPQIRPLNGRTDGEFFFIGTEEFRPEGGVRLVEDPDVSSETGSETEESDQVAEVEPSDPKTLEAGKIFRDCKTCPELVVLPTGRFRMGALKAEKDSQDDERPVRYVTIRKPIAVGRFEIARGEFAAFIDDTGYEIGANCHGLKADETFGRSPELDWRFPGFVQPDDHPVVCVTWNDAKAYIAWLNEKTGLTGDGRYRLLSEAEWEFAARGITDSRRAPRYPWGNDPDYNEICKHANGADLTAKKRFTGWTAADCEDGFVFTAPPRAFPPNAFGLYNMHGNVWEWVEDCWHKSYDGNPPSDGTAWTTGCDDTRRVLRGGSWDFTPQLLRSANRYGDLPENRSDNDGFRIARTL